MTAPRITLLLLALALTVPAALAHGGQPGIDEQLVENGQRLQLGTFTAPQPGLLVVVPYIEGPLGCSPPLDADYRIGLTPESGVSFAANASALAAYFDLPSVAEGYASFAVDTHDATRALILMEENAVALHALQGVVVRGTTLDERSGALGVPYPIAGTAMHDMQGFVPEGGGLVMDHDGSFLGSMPCAGDERGHLAILFDSAALPDSFAPGRLVHAVAMYDPTLAQFPPRPLDGTTGVLQTNLYLARPGEDPARVREALDPSLSAREWVPLGVLLVGWLWLGRP